MANLDDAFGEDSKALQRIGGAIGLLADLSGGLSTVVGVIDFVQGLFGTGGTDPTLQALQDIENIVALILTDQKGEDLLARWRDLDQYLIPAEGVFRNLIADVNATPPLSTGEKSDRILTCLDAVLAFEIGEEANAFEVYEGQGLNGYGGLLSYDGTFSKTFVPDQARPCLRRSTI
jgi:hypothetical protein